MVTPTAHIGYASFQPITCTDIYTDNQTEEPREPTGPQHRKPE